MRIFLPWKYIALQEYVRYARNVLCFSILAIPVRSEYASAQLPLNSVEIEASSRALSPFALDEERKLGPHI